MLISGTHEHGIPVSRTPTLAVLCFRCSSASTPWTRPAAASQAGICFASLVRPKSLMLEIACATWCSQTTSQLTSGNDELKVVLLTRPRRRAGAEDRLHCRNTFPGAAHGVGSAQLVSNGCAGGWLVALAEQVEASTKASVLVKLVGTCGLEWGKARGGHQ